MNIKMLILFPLLVLLLSFVGCECDEDSNEDDDNELVCDGDVCTDPNSGLMWQIEDNCEYCYWSDADEHCQNLKLGGFDDWRLPTISDARSLIRGCPATETGGPCGITNSCVSEEDCWNEFCQGCEVNMDPDIRGKYAPTVFKEVLNIDTSSVQSYDRNWSVYFHTGGIGSFYAIDKEVNASIYCVRDAD